MTKYEIWELFKSLSETLKKNLLLLKIKNTLFPNDLGEIFNFIFKKGN